MNTENRKINEPHKFVLNFPKRLYKKDYTKKIIKSVDKHVSPQSLFIYHTWNNVRKQHKNNKLKIIASTWNDEFELPYVSYPVWGFQDYIECIIKYQ